MLKKPEYAACKIQQTCTSYMHGLGYIYAVRVL